MSTAERRLLHGEIAYSLETIYEGHRGDIAAQLLHHFREAGEWGKALGYARQAAQRAKALYAYDEAIQHLKTALDLLEAENQPEMRLALLEELADIHSLFRDNASVAISLYLAALEQLSNMVGADNMVEIRLHRKILELAYVMRDWAEFQPLGSLSSTVAKSHAYLENGYVASGGKIAPFGVGACVDSSGKRYSLQQ